jgi:uncharacterized GH25 family protein
MMRFFATIVLLVLAVPWCAAHDVWLQTNTNVVRSGDAVHVDVLLGNHGNDHRDFKLAGKPSLADAAVQIVAPGGQAFDLKDKLVDTGYAPQEGFWTARFVPADSGLYVVGHLSDQVMSYGPVRSVKSAKTCFVVSPTLDKVSPANPGFDRPLGHPLELVPIANPVTPMGPGTPLRVRLLYKGRPLAAARVSFIPRGQTLAEGLDSQYERTTSDSGEASFTPTFGTYYLVVAHHLEPTESGPKYDRTKYSATLCVYVPQVCPCCTE